jgi:hypothetical protein
MTAERHACSSAVETVSELLLRAHGEIARFRYESGSFCAGGSRDSRFVFFFGIERDSKSKNRIIARSLLLTSGSN